VQSGENCQFQVRREATSEEAGQMKKDSKFRRALWKWVVPWRRCPELGCCGWKLTGFIDRHAE